MLRRALRVSPSTAKRDRLQGASRLPLQLHPAHSAALATPATDPNTENTLPPRQHTHSNPIAHRSRHHSAFLQTALSKLPRCITRSKTSAPGRGSPDRLLSFVGTD